MVTTSKQGKLFVISGASGAGKTSLAHDIIPQLACTFPIERVVTYTTRTARPGEINGSDYIFISEEELKQLNERNFFLETSKFNGHIYGSPSTLLDKLRCGISLLIVTDLNGMRSLKQKLPSCVTIWITATPEELRARLKQRGTEDKTTIAERIKLAAEHTAQAKKEHLVDHVIVNESFDKALKDLAELMKKCVL